MWVVGPERWVGDADCARLARARIQVRPGGAQARGGQRLARDDARRPVRRQHVGEEAKIADLRRAVQGGVQAPPAGRAGAAHLILEVVLQRAPNQHWPAVRVPVPHAEGVGGVGHVRGRARHRKGARGCRTRWSEGESGEGVAGGLDSRKRTAGAAGARAGRGAVRGLYCSRANRFSSTLGTGREAMPLLLSRRAS